MFKNKDDLNSLVICDLGIAGELKNIFSKMDDKCGTLTFMAPEILMDRQYDNLVDIWSTGIIMYILESGGSHPLLDIPKTKTKYIDDIKSKKQFYFPKNFPLIARNLFLKMCKYEPCFRYDVDKSLNHPWITRENQNIPLTVIDNLLKVDKISTFKEMIMAMIFLSKYKNMLCPISENTIMKRKLKIKKNNFEQDLYPSPFNSNLNFQKKLSSPINENHVFCRTNSKVEGKYKNFNSSRLRNFNTAQKQCDRYIFQTKNSFSSIKRSNIIYERNLSQNKINNKFPSSKLIAPILKPKKSSANTINSDINNRNLRTPMHLKKKTSFAIESENKNLISRMLKNKENLNINCLSNKNIINF